jgi:hypothetical protein
MEVGLDRSVSLPYNSRPQLGGRPYSLRDFN